MSAPARHAPIKACPQGAGQQHSWAWSCVWISSAAGPLLDLFIMLQLGLFSLLLRLSFYRVLSFPGMSMISMSRSTQSSNVLTQTTTIFLHTQWGKNTFAYLITLKPSILYITFRKSHNRTLVTCDQLFGGPCIHDSIKSYISKDP